MELNIGEPVIFEGIEPPEYVETDEDKYYKRRTKYMMESAARELGGSTALVLAALINQQVEAEMARQLVCAEVLEYCAEHNLTPEETGEAVAQKDSELKYVYKNHFAPNLQSIAGELKLRAKDMQKIFDKLKRNKLLHRLNDKRKGGLWLFVDLGEVERFADGFEG